jgi:hypothetical protein
MDNLREIIHTLNDEEKKEFKVFINRQKQKRNRKDLDLFNVLQERHEYKPKVIIERLYDKPNKEAYHALRKRLIRHIMEFIVLKRMDDDTTTASSVMGMLSLSRYLFDHNSPRLGWLYSRKAEELATVNEQFDLLNTTYNLQIEYATSEHADELEEIIEKRNANKLLADEDERANIASMIIRRQLREFRLTSEAVDFDKHIKKVLNDYDLSEAMIKRPKLLFNIMSMTRSAILAKKDFHPFEPYIIEQYRLVNEKYGFSKTNHFYRLSLLYMIAHVLYRNRKFEEAIIYLDELGENVSLYSKGHRVLFYPKYALLLAAIKSYQGVNKQSIAILEEVLNDDQLKLSVRNNLNIHLNLAVYYFQQEEHSKANKILLHIHHTDKWCEKKMGREWLLRKNLIEMIIQFELGNDDIALNRIRSMERYFNDLLKYPMFLRVKTFIGFIKQYINDPMWVTSDDFKTFVDNNLQRLPVEQEDLQAMAFYCWLKSKMLKRNYYKVLVETVNAKETDED